MVLVREGEEGFGKEGDGRLAVRAGADVDGELAGAGAEEVAVDADVVAEVEEFVERKGEFADGVFADVDLEALTALLELGEAGLALGADGHDAAGDGDVDGLRFGESEVELLGWGVVVGGADLGDCGGEREVIGVSGFFPRKAELDADVSDLFEGLKAGGV